MWAPGKKCTRGSKKNQICHKYLAERLPARIRPAAAASPGARAVQPLLLIFLSSQLLGKDTSHSRFQTSCTWTGCPLGPCRTHIQRLVAAFS